MNKTGKLILTLLVLIGIMIMLGGTGAVAAPDTSPHVTTLKNSMVSTSTAVYDLSQYASSTSRLKYGDTIITGGDSVALFCIGADSTQSGNNFDTVIGFSFYFGGDSSVIQRMILYRSATNTGVINRADTIWSVVDAEKNIKSDTRYPWRNTCDTNIMYIYAAGAGDTYSFGDDNDTIWIVIETATGLTSGDTYKIKIRNVMYAAALPAAEYSNAVVGHRFIYHTNSATVDSFDTGIRVCTPTYTSYVTLTVDDDTPAVMFNTVYYYSNEKAVGWSDYKKIYASQVNGSANGLAVPAASITIKATINDTGAGFNKYTGDQGCTILLVYYDTPTSVTGHSVFTYPNDNTYDTVAATSITSLTGNPETADAGYSEFTFTIPATDLADGDSLNYAFVLRDGQGFETTVVSAFYSIVIDTQPASFYYHGEDRVQSAYNAASCSYVQIGILGATWQDSKTTSDGDTGEILSIYDTLYVVFDFRNNLPYKDTSVLSMSNTVDTGAFIWADFGALGLGSVYIYDTNADGIFTYDTVLLSNVHDTEINHTELLNKTQNYFGFRLYDAAGNTGPIKYVTFADYYDNHRGSDSNIAQIDLKSHPSTSLSIRKTVGGDTIKYNDVIYYDVYIPGYAQYVQDSSYVTIETTLTTSADSHPKPWSVSSDTVSFKVTCNRTDSAVVAYTGSGYNAIYVIQVQDTHYNVYNTAGTYTYDTYHVFIDSDAQAPDTYVFCTIELPTGDVAKVHAAGDTVYAGDHLNVQLKFGTGKNYISKITADMRRTGGTETLQLTKHTGATYDTYTLDNYAIRFASDSTNTIHYGAQMETTVITFTATDVYGDTKSYKSADLKTYLSYLNGIVNDEIPVARYSFSSVTTNAGDTFEINIGDSINFSLAFSGNRNDIVEWITADLRRFGGTEAVSLTNTSGDTWGCSILLGEGSDSMNWFDSNLSSATTAIAIRINTKAAYNDSDVYKTTSAMSNYAIGGLGGDTPIDNVKPNPVTNVAVNITGTNQAVVEYWNPIQKWTAQDFDTVVLAIDTALTGTYYTISVNDDSYIAGTKADAEGGTITIKLRDHQNIAVKLIAVDNAGNQTDTPAYASTTGYSTGPLCTIALPEAGTSWGSVSGASITYAVVDKDIQNAINNATISQITMTMETDASDSVDKPVYGSGLMSPAGSNLNLNPGNVFVGYEGNLYLKAKAYDANTGKWGLLSDSICIKVDFKNPTLADTPSISDTKVYNLDVVYTGKQNETVKVYTTDNSGIKQIGVWLKTTVNGAADKFQIGDTITYTTDTKTVIATWTTDLHGLLSDNNRYQLYTVVIDNKSNITKSTSAQFRILDTLAPLVSINSVNQANPSTNEIKIQPGTILVGVDTGTYYNRNKDITYVRYQYQKVGSDTWYDMGVSYPSSTEIRDTFFVSFDGTNLTDGDYSLKAIASDNSGNTSTSDLVFFNIDSNGPPVTIALMDVGANNYDTITAGYAYKIGKGDIYFKLTPTDNELDIASIDLKYRDIEDPILESQYHKLDTAAIVMDLDKTIYKITNMADTNIDLVDGKTYEIRIKVTDDYGRVGVADSIFVTIDETAPAMAFESINGDSALALVTIPAASTNVPIIVSTPHTDLSLLQLCRVVAGNTEVIETQLNPVKTHTYLNKDYYKFTWVQVNDYVDNEDTTLWIYAVDNVGNEISSPNQVVKIIGTSPAAVTLLAPATGTTFGRYIDTSAFTVYVSSSDVNNVAIEYKNSNMLQWKNLYNSLIAANANNLYYNDTTILNTGGNNPVHAVSSIFNKVSKQSFEEGPGAYQVRAKVTDADGNATYSSEVTINYTTNTPDDVDAYLDDLSKLKDENGAALPTVSYLGITHTVINETVALNVIAPSSLISGVTLMAKSTSGLNSGYTAFNALAIDYDTPLNSIEFGPEWLADGYYAIALRGQSTYDYFTTNDTMNEKVKYIMIDKTAPTLGTNSDSQIYLYKVNDDYTPHNSYFTLDSALTAEVGGIKDSEKVWIKYDYDGRDTITLASTLSSASNSVSIATAGKNGISKIKIFADAEDAYGNRVGGWTLIGTLKIKETPTAIIRAIDIESGDVLATVNSTVSDYVSFYVNGVLKQTVSVVDSIGNAEWDANEKFVRVNLTLASGDTVYARAYNNNGINQPADQYVWTVTKTNDEITAVTGDMTTLIQNFRYTFPFAGYDTMNYDFSVSSSAEPVDETHGDTYKTAIIFVEDGAPGAANTLQFGGINQQTLTDQSTSIHSNPLDAAESTPVGIEIIGSKLYGNYGPSITVGKVYVYVTAIFQDKIDVKFFKFIDNRLMDIDVGEAVSYTDPNATDYKVDVTFPGSTLTSDAALKVRYSDNLPAQNSSQVDNPGTAPTTAYPFTESEGYKRVGKILDLSLTNGQTSFDRWVKVKMSFSAADLGANYANLRPAYWDGTGWRVNGIRPVDGASTYTTTSTTIEFEVSHFTQFTLFAKTADLTMSGQLYSRYNQPGVINLPISNGYVDSDPILVIDVQDGLSGLNNAEITVDITRPGIGLQTVVNGFSTLADGSGYSLNVMSNFIDTNATYVQTTDGSGRNALIVIAFKGNAFTDSGVNNIKVSIENKLSEKTAATSVDFAVDKTSPDADWLTDGFIRAVEPYVDLTVTDGTNDASIVAEAGIQEPSTLMTNMKAYMLIKREMSGNAQYGGSGTAATYDTWTISGNQMQYNATNNTLTLPFGYEIGENLDIKIGDITYMATNVQVTLEGLQDKAGNVSPKMIWTYVVDRNAPAIKRLTSTSGENVLYQVTDDKSGVCQVWYQYSDSTAVNPVTVNDLGIITVPLREAGAVFVVAQDTAGNKSDVLEDKSPMTELPLRVSKFVSAPNPAISKDGLTFIYELNKPVDSVNIDIYDFAGVKVATLNNETTNLGKNYVEWRYNNIQGDLVANGVYIAHMTVTQGSEVVTKVFKVAIAR